MFQEHINEAKANLIRVKFFKLKKNRVIALKITQIENNQDFRM